ncbi:MAG: type II toxin-antitoxin system VapB family antitoxin [Stellaceae bacterium]
MRVDQADRARGCRSSGGNRAVIGLHPRSAHVYNWAIIYTKGIAMRTNIEIDDKLIQEAQQLSGFKTKKAVVHEALQTLIRHKKRRKILDLAGKVEWVGNLDEMREGRFSDDPR